MQVTVYPLSFIFEILTFFIIGLVLVFISGSFKFTVPQIEKPFNPSLSYA
ncbi:hypothetical protein CLORAM_03218 [Thomasclavelia ramosa DSM 1402]|uniref:Uncharacterized protein n=1 Tax=Thomasclavelia ramosa DSM 1402 TaxID=445974 RepID=B0N987_9FIRM|nr:hypothetical protein CLORAM_03218 [Thomasclavelia ramosa DSM 1402]